MKHASSKLIALLLVASVGFIASCKKDKDDDSLAITKENIAGTYTIASMKASANGSADVDVFTTYYEACERDDEYTFKTDGTYVVVDAGTACDPKDDLTEKWSLDGTKITYYGDEETVKSVTKSQLVTEVTYNQSGIKYTQTTTWKKK